MFGGFCGQLFLKHQARLRYNFKESGSRRKRWSISHVSYISSSCLPDFFFLIKKGKMGQPQRIFTTFRINTRPMQPHKLHFWSLFPTPLSVAFGVLYLEPRHRQRPGNCPPSILCTVRTCFLSGGKRTGVVLDYSTASSDFNRTWWVEDLRAKEKLVQPSLAPRSLRNHPAS